MRKLPATVVAANWYRQLHLPAAPIEVTSVATDRVSNDWNPPESQTLVGSRIIDTTQLNFLATPKFIETALIVNKFLRTTAQGKRNGCYRVFLNRYRTPCTPSSQHTASARYGLGEFFGYQHARLSTTCGNTLEA